MSLELEYHTVSSKEHLPNKDITTVEHAALHRTQYSQQGNGVADGFTGFAF